mgnify:CR=1 FL=1|tara:strand:+ start:2209 stop:3192 length:984 start_codon:yes stop_codon:yes gene_type:complete
MATYKSIQTDVLNLMGGDTSGDDKTMVKASINRAYRRCLEEADLDHEHREFSLTTVASTSQYGMPLYVREVLNIEDDNNDRTIFSISALEYDTSYPGQGGDGGDPTRAYRFGTRGVEKQISTAETVRIESSSASDAGGNFKVRVTGFDASDRMLTETLQMNGTSAVTSTNTYASIERVTKLAATGSSWTGYLSLKGTTSGTTFAIIPLLWDSPDYQWWEFYPTPDTARTYVVRANMRKPDLLNDEDWPEMDTEFHSLLIWGAFAEIGPAIGKSNLSDRLERRFENGLSRLASGTQTEPNRVRVFADVQTVANIPARPLIPGIDYGLA